MPRATIVSPRTRCADDRLGHNDGSKTNYTESRCHIMPVSQCCQRITGKTGQGGKQLFCLLREYASSNFTLKARSPIQTKYAHKQIRL